jgi:Phenylacetic acid degradation B.
MVEKADRRADATGSRSADGRRFEVFVRAAESDPLRHVGTVAAPTAADAHEEASRLFAWYARDVWVCPAAAVSRYSTESLSSDADEGGPDREAAEPRVREETEGTPAVAGDAPADDAEGGR